ncbi:two-component sensor histidine kinase [Streptomyces longispororuber]|uniref:histidine kinase n=1 Tax=Streptomyces longispororuber TaxID=68230 RepID=A0A918ZM64_9ACTN|nr:histidine kinase [Streptomyces longispororuber]GHE60017.1 two-component sensor histidine kinase [Streptomyces longispororuber]
MPRPRIPPARSLLVDGALWAVLAAATGYGFRDASAASSVVDLLLPLAVLAVAVPLSRGRPGASVLLVNGLCALGLADAASPANAQALSLAAVSCLLGVRVAQVRGPLLVLAACLAIDVTACAVLRVPPVWWFYALAVLPTALLPPWLAGRHWRGRRELVREGWRLARSLEERQHLVAERARLTERADIAADMHDSLGHTLSLVALRAGALELSPDLTDRDRADLAELRGTIADAVEHLRETVALLHEPRSSGTQTGTEAETAAGAGADGPPGKDTVEDLLGRAVASGVPVRWERQGMVPALPPLVERGMYRVVREALTNAVKHAPGGAVTVAIDHRATCTRVSVVNAPAAGRAGAPAPRPDGTRGRGLAGLQERVTMLGGTLRAGPHQGGFRVTAVLPHQAPPRRAARPAPSGPPAYGDADLDPAPQAAERLAAVRRAARRRSLAAFAAPVAAAAFFAPAALYLAWQLTTGVLPPSRFDQVRPGQSRVALTPLLPARAFPYAPDHARAAPRPPGCRCEFYRSGRDLLQEVDLYRLCWSGDTLVSKDTVAASAR